MSELAKRVIVSIVAVPIVLGAAYVGGGALGALLGIVSALATWELFRMAAEGGVRPLGIGIGVAAVIPLAVQAWFQGVFFMPLSAIAAVMLLIVALSIWQRGVGGRPLAAVAITVFAALYTGGTLSFAYGLRYHRWTIGAAAGTALLLLPVVLTWASDIGAYAVGRTIGRRKLIPAVSPGKTVEGAVGALVVTTLVAWLYVRTVLEPVGHLSLTVPGIVVFGVGLSIAAQLGDLAESLFKREAGVKDSSHLIPGHGGVLDRMDSLFFVLPIAYLLLDRLQLLHAAAS